MTGLIGDEHEAARSPSPSFFSRMSMQVQPLSGNTTEAAPETAPPLTPRTVWVLTIGCGLAVANLYYAQPLLADLANKFEVSNSRMGLAVTLSQAGYGLGMLFFVPLGDVIERRRLIVFMLLAVTLALFATAFAPNFYWFCVANLVLGMTTITPQLIVPLAATLARPEERGRVVGMVMSGLLIGILGSRTVSGFIAGRLGWQAVFLIAGGVNLALALILRLLLPRSEPQGPTLPYPQLLASLPTLMREEPVLRQSCLFGAITFGAMSAFWTTLAFYLGGPPYGYGSDMVGLFGLVGVAGAAAASVAGRLADYYSPRIIIGAGLVLMMLAYVLFWFAGDQLLWLIVGVIILDLGAQAAHISNQTRIYAIRPEARNRMNTAYMVSFFAGGALGSALGSWAWGQWGWPGVCGVSLLMLGVGLIYFFRTTEEDQTDEPVQVEQARS